MSSELLARVLGTVFLSALLFFPATARSTQLETTIDLNYTYKQDHLGDSITGATQVTQKYGVAYESALTSIFDLLLKATLEIEDNFEDDAADTSKLAPSVEIAVVGPRASMVLTYDAARSRTDQYQDAAAVETFDNTYKAEFEIIPDYMPAAKLTLERKRKYEESTKDDVEETVQFELRKEIEDLKLEFTYDHKDTEKFPGRLTGTDVAWAAEAAYKSTVWWDVDVDLTYEIQEKYSEDFERGVFVEDEKEYTQNIQFALNKSLDLTPRISADIAYDYEFEQDLLLREFDYKVSQDIGLALDWLLFHWLNTGAEITREIDSEYNVSPEDKSQLLTDTVEVAFAAKPLRWLQFAGKSKWEFEEEIEPNTGGSVQNTDNAVYELSMRHKWGKWWTLLVAGSSQYEYTNDWITQRKGKIKADLQLVFYELVIEPSYELERETLYTAFDPLDIEQKRTEEFGLTLDFAHDFSRFIQAAFTQGFTLTKEETVDAVLSFVEVVELSEETKIKVALVDIIKDLTLEGEVTRKATDTEHDDEPMLVNIAYALTLDWVIDDVELGLTYKYDDNGDSFDESSINTKVAWQYENIDVSGEYQFDKIYAYEIDEQRKFNVKMNVLF